MQTGSGLAVAAALLLLPRWEQNTHGTGSVLATAGAKAQGTGSVLATAGAEAQGTGSVAAALTRFDRAGWVGTFDNVIVMKPPMCFSVENAGQFLAALDSILGR